MSGAEQAGDQPETYMQISQLADGTEVPYVVMHATGLSVDALIEQYGAVAAVDLRGLAEGEQPQRTPWYGDLREQYADIGLCGAGKDGTLTMHDDIARVIRNSVHVNPNDVLDVRVTDPREPFEGFRDQGQDTIAPEARTSSLAEPEARVHPEYEGIVAEGLRVHHVVNYFKSREDALAFVERLYGHKRHRVLEGMVDGEGIVHAAGPGVITVFYE